MQGVAHITFMDGKLYAVLAGGGCSHGNTKSSNAGGYGDRASLKSEKRHQNSYAGYFAGC
jgi:hypothetical protein